MRPTLEQFEAAVRSQICSICAKRTAEGLCGDQEPERCSLFALFPLVAQAILATDSDDLQPYIDAIHEHVCSVCIDQRLDGTCPQRDQRQCALDACMPQVVQAMEEALGRPLRSERATPIQAQ
jgi:hypothetical protein